MTQKTCPVPCGCGVVHPVASSAAGMRLSCSCGATVEVPSLVRLKASVGESAVSPDFEIEQRLRDGSLPVESCCVVCEESTENTRLVAVECERQETIEKNPLPMSILLWLLFGWWSFLFRPLIPGSETKSIGRDVRYRLPVRICCDCEQELETADGRRAVVRETALYARLLRKYPNARMS